MGKKAWQRIPEGAMCVKCAIEPATVTHHTLNKKYPCTGSPAQGVKAIRNEERYLQRLCSPCHVGGHRPYNLSGMWPEGFGKIDKPFVI